MVPSTFPEPTLDHSKLSKCTTITIHVVRRQPIQRIPSSRTSTTHAFILRNRPFSLSALPILFLSHRGDVGAWVILWLVECFRIHVQSGCPCPSFSSVPTVFRIDCNPCSLSLEHSPHTRDLHHPFSFISTPSSTYQFPLRNLHTFELSPPFPPTPSRLINHLPFHNRSAQHLCIFLAILFSQFYCTTVLFVLHPSPPLSARGRRHPKLAP